MASSTIDTSAAKPANQYLLGVSKHLSRIFYGPEGPKWGTTITEIEEVVLSVLHTLGSEFMSELLQNQANTFDQRPVPLRFCPVCGNEVDFKDTEPRTVQTRVGVVTWNEPTCYCRKCRRSFFPQTKGLGMDRSELTPGMQQKIVYAGTNLFSFENAADALNHLADLKIDPKQIERLTQKTGSERCAERDQEVKGYMSLPLVERKEAPAGVEIPEVAVVGVDGGRMQILDRSAKNQSSEPIAAEETVKADANHRGKHWREDKIGVLMTMKSEAVAEDPCPEVPEVYLNLQVIAKLTREIKTSIAVTTASNEEAATEAAIAQEVAKEMEFLQETVRETAFAQETAKELVFAQGTTKEAAFSGKNHQQPSGGAGKPELESPKIETKHLTATRQSWAVFGPIVATLAWSLGFFKAVRKAFIGDGSKTNWTMWENHFSSFEPILDIIHAITYLFAAAMTGRSIAEGWSCYLRWIDWVWKGEVCQVIDELSERKKELAASQDRDKEKLIVNQTLTYLQNNQNRMKYPEYRKNGLPITSSYVESAVKQFNQRVKGTEKFWSEKGAEAILQLRADYLSDGEQLDIFWKNKQKNSTGLNNYTKAA